MACLEDAEDEEEDVAVLVVGDGDGEVDNPRHAQDEVKYHG